MTVDLAGRSPATFEIKSANLPLVSLLLKSGDAVALAQELQARFGDAPDFFDNDPLVIDLAPLQLRGDSSVNDVTTELDFPALMTLLRGFRVMPVAVRGGTPAQMQAALAAGLAPAADVAPAPRRADPPPPAPARAPVAAEVMGALVIDRPLRSGQQIYARGRDLIVMAMVNPGAEVIADGHIHVYAPLRGKAIAGARGNADARIFSTCLEPELISIAGVYRTSDVPLPADVLSRPTQVRLVGGVEGKLVMDPLG
ncbi:MAG TPA: septum site-determining protein MinC [Ramlibacter sp.]|nr:septum site-determining protein MinC [Ramlibacter sp.]